MRDVRMAAPMTTTLKPIRPARMVRFRSRNSIYGEVGKEDESDWESVVDEDESDAPLSSTVLPVQSTMPLRFYRLSIFAFVLAVMLPILSMSPISRIGVRGDLIPGSTIEAEAERSVVVKRADSPTSACKRWAGQSTIVNGTMYMYGFRQNDSPKDDQDTWSKSYAMLKGTIANFSRQQLPQPRPHQIMANLQPLPHRPPTTFWSTCRLAWYALGLDLLALAIRRPVLRQAESQPRPELSLGVRYQRQAVERAQESQNLRRRCCRRRRPGCTKSC